MNYIEQIFERCNTETLCYFLMNGEELAETSNEGYYERARKAEKRLRDWAIKEFKDKKELDEHFSLIYSVLEELQSVYMEIGFLTGIMFSNELKEKTQ